MSNLNHGTADDNSRKNWDLVTWLFIAIVVLFAFHLMFNKGTAIKAGEIAPELQLLRISDEDQQTYKWQGKPSVLHFWATWCTACVRNIDHSTRLAHKLQQQGISYWMINTDAPYSTMALREFLKRHNISSDFWRVHLRDPSNKASGLFRIGSLPTIVVIDQQGRVTHSIIGAASEKQILQLLNQSASGS
jgi:peroxiredoxin